MSDQIIQIAVNDRKLFALTKQGRLFVWHLYQWKEIKIPEMN